MTHINRDDSRLTIKEQVAEILKDKIQDGSYPVNSKLPSVRALAAEYQISRETANLAIGILKQMGYIEILPGRGAFIRNLEDEDLITGTTGSIGLVYDLGANLEPTVGIHTVYENLLLEINKSLSEKNYHMITSHLSYAQEHGREAFERLAASVDGIIVACLINQDFLARLEKLSIPVVSVFSNLEIDRFDAIGINAMKTFYFIARSMISYGHEHLVYLDGPERTFQEQQRVAGILRAIGERTDTHVEFSECNAEDWTASAAIHEIGNLLEKGKSIDCIICVNDVMAAAAYQACVEHGLRIPEDISITGSKNTSLSMNLGVKLTSCDYHFDEISRIAVHRIRERLINSKLSPSHIDLTGTWILRDSVFPRG